MIKPTPALNRLIGLIISGLFILISEGCDYIIPEVQLYGVRVSHLRAKQESKDRFLVSMRVRNLDSESKLVEIDFGIDRIYKGLRRRPDGVIKLAGRKVRIKLGPDEQKILHEPVFLGKKRVSKRHKYEPYAQLDRVQLMESK